MLFDLSNITVDNLQDDLFQQKQVSVSVLRLDKIHPLVSGNKIFKLQYFLEAALKAQHKTVLTFGGSYSNHLAATAYACKLLNLKSIGMVRGERPEELSPTLLQCIEDGMELKFLSRADYDRTDDPEFINGLKNQSGDCTIIPEGGFHNLGAKGAALILDQLDSGNYTHICTATGTATTTAGLLIAAKPEQTVVSIPVLKGMKDLISRVQHLTKSQYEYRNLKILDSYHFGGYAKKNDILTGFMNECWIKHRLPLDFVYTGKMFYGIVDSIKNNLFEKESKILCLHTGGLQGNKSLPLNTILF